MQKVIGTSLLAAVVAAGIAGPAGATPSPPASRPAAPVVFALDPVSAADATEATAVPLPAPEASTEAVIGPDNRKKVKDTTKPLPRKVVQLLIEFENLPGSLFLCTGFVIAQVRVATAGHCVYDHQVGGGALESVTAVPGRKGSNFPFGSCAGVSAAATQAWVDDENPEFDAGFIDLNCNVGNTTGIFTLKKWVGAAPGATVKVNGYPGDRGGGTRQFRSKGDVTAVATAHLFYDTDTSGGESGAPVHNRKQFGCICAVAIHTLGSPVPPYNAGVRITSDIKSFLLDTTV